VEEGARVFEKDGCRPRKLRALTPPRRRDCSFSTGHSKTY
jgi:hypothetical protein